jgi:hypothetical protein
MLNKKAIIRTPFPTLDEVAEFYGITPERRLELDRISEEIRVKNVKSRKAARLMKAAAAKRAKKK